MKRERWLTVVGAGFAGLLAVVPAEARSGGAAKSQVSGTVESVDTGNKEITVSGSSETLTVTKETQIVKDGQRATLSEVKEGDEVRASYSESGATPQVQRLEVTGGPTFNDNG